MFDDERKVIKTLGLTFDIVAVTAAISMTTAVSMTAAISAAISTAALSSIDDFDYFHFMEKEMFKFKSKELVRFSS